MMEQPEHLSWDGVHGEALRTALRQFPGVFEAALLPQVGFPEVSFSALLLVSCYRKPKAPEFMRDIV